MENNKNFYITTPIYYINAKPHIGHAYTNLSCDVIARFKRLADVKVKFLTGTDEHGQKVLQSANNQNLSPQKFADSMHKHFVALNDKMLISNDDFIRTTQERHTTVCKNFWNKLLKSEQIYLDNYSGWYSISDEAFVTKSDIGIDENNNKINKNSGDKLIWLEEPSYFFKLSQWQDKLLKLYETNPNYIQPQSKRNEMISFVKSGLRDLSVSRVSVDWGVKIDEKHTMYVWLDALINYISAIQYSVNDTEFNQYWPADLHMVGKDIIKFHAIYWSALLMAANMPLPKRIFAHGWWLNNNKKISKSLNNRIDIELMIKKYGIDQLRYFMIREITFGNDGNFSEEALIKRINSELANEWGNLVQRNSALITKYLDNKLPTSKSLLPEDTNILQGVYDLPKLLKQDIDEQNLYGYLDKIIGKIQLINKYYANNKPWDLASSHHDRFVDVIWTASEVIRCIALLLQPITPLGANKILDNYSIKPEERKLIHIHNSYALQDQQNIKHSQPIYPRIK